ncbi:tetratricopeptide repeat protein [Arenibaculum sp.]|uniref:tetratricopeptide repeat protein n=1 Tax=Arenibaculum sp. TaxID=2865862 RepID=UPI002E0E316A|nr:tetratricopeptide repeat protein [Arenibaculum sp.]
MLERLLTLAERFYQAGRPADAAQACLQALAVSPDHYETLSLLGALALQAGDPGLSAAAYRHMAALRPDDPAAFSGLGGVLLDTGEPAAAARCLRRVLRLAPDDRDGGFNLALALRGDGDLEGAVDAYRAVLALDPGHHEAAFNMGNALMALGRPGAAADAFRTALASDPLHEGARLNLALALVAAGRTEQAADAFRSCLALAPRDARAMVGLSRALCLTGRMAEARDWCARALDEVPDGVEAWMQRASLDVLEGRFEDAVAAYRHALACDPASLEAWSGLASVLGTDGGAGEARDAEGAVRAFRRAVALRPRSAEHWNNLGVALNLAGRYAEAGDVLRHSLALGPGEAQGWYNLGNALHLSFESEPARRAFRRATLAGPGWADAFYRLHVATISPGRYEEAARIARHALALDPAHAMAQISLGDIEQDRGRHLYARECYRRAHRLTGDAAMRVKRAITLPIIPASHEEIATVRRRFLEQVEALRADGIRLHDPRRQVSQTSFYLAYHAADDLPLQQALARLYQEACPSLGYVAPHCARPPRPSAGRRLRIGFVSSYFHAHTISRLNRGLVERLDRTRFDPVLITTPHAGDPMRRLMAQAAGRVLEVPSADLAQARALIAAQELDVLYYTDIGMDPLTYFLAFARLAPVQTLTWGHPDTTGIPNIDWFLTCDAMEPEDAERHYTEPLARLPGPTIWYPRPELPRPAKRRPDFGLPENAHLYVCPQSLFKVHPDFDPVLIELLRRDPLGVLVLIQGRDPHVAGLLLDRLRRAGPDVIGRVRLLSNMPTADFINLMAVCDVMLDPLHYSGGNTSLEAFAVGTPIVTWPGEFMRGRHTYGFYKLMGVEDCVARDHAHYLELALRLGTDPGFRTTAVRRILDASGVLFENDATVRAIEDFLAAAVDRAAVGGGPGGTR